MDFALLYDEDPETWSEVQVAILRRLAVTLGPGTNAIDWENVIEEVEDLGRAQRRAIEGLLENAFEHLLKIAADPSSFSAKQWKREVGASLAQAQAKMRPAMRQRIDLDKIWRRARQDASSVLEAFDRRLPEVVTRCPYSFDEISDGAFDPLGNLRAVLAPKTAQP